MRVPPHVSRKFYLDLTRHVGIKVSKNVKKIANVIYFLYLCMVLRIV